MYRFAPLALCVLAMAAPAIAQEQRPAVGGPPTAPQDWTLTVGLVPIFGSAWQGSRDTALSIFPDIRVNYKDAIFVSVPDGLGWNAVNAEGWKAGPVIKPRVGRNERNGGSPFQLAGGSDALLGMGDIGFGGEAGGFVEKRFGPGNRLRWRIEVRQGFGAHEGIVGDVSLAIQARSGRAIISGGPRATIASRDFVQTYFGVDAAQAQRTGLAVSRPEGGLVSYGFGGAVVQPLDRRRVITLFGGADRLGGEPGGTSLIRERGQRTQFTVGLGYGMRFGL